MKSIKKEIAKTLIFWCFVLSFCTCLVLGLPEFKSTDNYLITVTNSSQAITGATIDYEVFSNDRSLVENGQLSEWQHGDYYFALSGIPANNTSYFIHLNITYDSNEIHVSDQILITDNYAKQERKTITTYVDAVETNQATLDSYLNSNLTADYVWNHSERILTSEAPAVCNVVVDLGKEGPTNSTYYHGSPSHILGSVEPEEQQTMATNFYNRVIFDLGSLPTNITDAWVIYWLKKNGNPTDNLTIKFEDTIINVTTTSKITTSWVKHMLPFDSSLLTDPYVEIDFIGNASYTVANDVYVGQGDYSPINSYVSSDGSTWAHANNEFVVGLIIEYNSTFIFDELIADAVWEEETEDHIITGSFGGEAGSIQENFSVIDTNTANLHTSLDSNFTMIQNNFSQVINDSTFGLQAIKDYLVLTLYAYLVDPIYVALALLTTDNIVQEVWNASIGYNNTAGTYPMKANETLKTIAENTEEGGW